MTTLYKIVNNQIVYLSDEEATEINQRKEWEINFNLPIQKRNERDVLLKNTDWSQGVDVPQSIKDKYATYRQALRDVPQQEGFPATVVWPTQP